MGNAAHHSETRRARILLLAFACGPQKGSEPGVGWNRALETAKQFDTWVLCEEHVFAPGIRDYLQKHGEIPGLQFVFVPRRRWEVLVESVPGINYLAYNCWHRRAIRAARHLHEEISFDLVHQLNICGYREPGYLWTLGVPFVWGPIGGTQNYPWRFLARAGWKTAIYEASRTIVNHLQLRLSPRVRRAARSARALLAANSTNQQDFARVLGIEPKVLIETGIRSLTVAASHEPRTGSRRFRILWSGLLIPRKALNLLIESLARLPDDLDYEVHVMGDGEMRDTWQRLAKRLGVDHRIQWMGWVRHSVALEQYASSDVFVFTSLRDTTGTVILEALGAGLPVIGLDHQGVRDVVTEDCGIKIPVTSPREVTSKLAESLVHLAGNPGEQERLSRGAVERAKRYLWSRLGDEMAAVYHQVLGCNKEECRTTHFDFSRRGEAPRHNAISLPRDAAAADHEFRAMNIN